MEIRGIGASSGAALADIYLLESADTEVTQQKGLGAEREKARFEDAVQKAKTELDALHESAMQTDENIAEVFEVHAMMLDDPDFCDGVDAQLDEGWCAEWAVHCSAQTLHDMFASMDDEYMKARADDVVDVSGRVIRILKGISDISGALEHKVIVAAEDLLPSQTVKLDRSKVAGFITARGSVTSHSVILARTMGIPCVVGVGEDFAKIPREGKAAIDGDAGVVVIDPSEQQAAEFLQKAQAHKMLLEELEQYRGKSAVTASGHKVLVCANIGGIEDAKTAIADDCDGVGLFRSEFLYLEGTDFPSEETQFEAYKAVLSALAPKPVVIRTLDLGSDKQAPYFNIGKEDNPALGYRAIRICLKQPEIFRTQLRALLRASAFGKLCVMFPMITHVEQVQQIKEILADVKSELASEGVKVADDMQIGIMIETPSAAVISDLLAKEVDFFSIGTNDLTQYTMAADRMNSNITELFDSSYVSVLRFIEMTAKNAHDNGIWVGICGESAANTKLTEFYMSIGIDELSVTPSSILAVKKAVLNS